MRSYILLSFLLFMSIAVSTAPVPRSIDFRLENTHEDAIDQVDIHLNVPPHVDTQQSDSNTGSISHDPTSKLHSKGKDPQEELVALCEAGFVSGCREAIERGRAEKASEPQPPAFKLNLLESVLSKLSPCSDSGRMKYVAWESFSLSLMVVSAAVVCTLVIARGICKHPEVVQDQKRPHDS